MHDPVPREPLPQREHIAVYKEFIPAPLEGYALPALQSVAIHIHPDFTGLCANIDFAGEVLVPNLPQRRHQPGFISPPPGQGRNLQLQRPDRASPVEIQRQRFGFCMDQEAVFSTAIGVLLHILAAHRYGRVNAHSSTWRIPVWKCALSVVKTVGEVGPIAEGPIPDMTAAGHVNVDVAQMESLARSGHCHQIPGIRGALVQRQPPASNLLRGEVSVVDLEARLRKLFLRHLQQERRELPIYLIACVRILPAYNRSRDGMTATDPFGCVASDHGQRIVREYDGLALLHLDDLQVPRAKLLLDAVALRLHTGVWLRQEIHSACRNALARDQQPLAVEHAHTVPGNGIAADRPVSVVEFHGDFTEQTFFRDLLGQFVCSAARNRFDQGANQVILPAVAVNDPPARLVIAVEGKPLDRQDEVELAIAHIQTERRPGMHPLAPPPDGITRCPLAGEFILIGAPFLKGPAKTVFMVRLPALLPKCGIDPAEIGLQPVQACLGNELQRVDSLLQKHLFPGEVFAADYQ